jgi:probable F420-dependent oxidoreductase
MLVAKMVATLDVLSRGRVILGVGVGWMREEFQALNLTTFEERGAATDEYIHILRELWTKEWPSYKGRFYSFDEIRFYPKPVHRPHPPIWIGGHTKAAIRRAARLGDGWHPIGLRPPAGLSPDEYAKAAADLRSQAEAAGRDPRKITLSFRAPIKFTDSAASAARTPFIGSRDQIVEDIRAAQWEKLYANIAINPVTAITGLNNGMLLEVPELKALVMGIVKESSRVSAAIGIKTGVDPVENAFRVIRDTAGNRSSMLQDISRGKRTEIDSLNGKVCELGRKAGVPTPYNQTLTALVKDLEK